MCRQGRVLPVMLALIVSAATPALAAPPEWGLVTLAGGRAGLPPRLGIATDVPVALVVGELIRVVHASNEPDNPAIETVRRYFASPPGSAAEQVPIPLSLSKWQDLLGVQVTEATLLEHLLLNRRASLLCYGLLQLDAETLATVTGDGGLLRRLYERRSGVFAAFAQVLRVREGRLILPGGDDNALTWTQLIGEPLTDPLRTIDSLMSADDGRLVYFIDAVAGLDASRLGLVFRGAAADRTPLDQAQSVYRAFTRVETGWKLGEFPFVRLGADTAMALPMLRTDPATGHLRHTRAFWDAVLGDQRLPDDVARRWADLDADERVEPGWLLRRLTDALLPVRVDRLLIYAFTERLTDRLPGASASTLAWLARGYRRYPALMLTLERLGIDDAAVLTRMVDNAGRVTSVAGDTSALEIGFALYQAPLALIARAHQARALDDQTARALVASLSEIEPADDGYGRAVARWFDTALLPALGFDSCGRGRLGRGHDARGRGGAARTGLPHTRGRDLGGSSSTASMSPRRSWRASPRRAASKGATRSTPCSRCADLAGRWPGPTHLPACARPRPCSRQSVTRWPLSNPASAPPRRRHPIWRRCRSKSLATWPGSARAGISSEWAPSRGDWPAQRMRRLPMC